MKSKTNASRGKIVSRGALGLALLFGCMSAGGCSYAFDISVLNLDSSTPVFQFAKPLMVSPRGQRHRVKLNRFGVVAKGDQGWDYKNPVWAFSRAPGSYTVIGRVTYGSTPAGFEQTIEAKPLSVGVPYLAIASGAGGGGAREFQLR